MKLGNVINAVYGKPWAVRADVLSSIDALIRSKLASTPTDVANELRAAKKKKQEEDEEEYGDMSRSIKSRSNGSELVTWSGDDATIEINGVLAPRLSWVEKACMDCTDTLDVIRAVQYVMWEGANKLTLQIDSPGGAVTSIPEAANVIVSAAELFDVVAETRGMMCSAAYWLACAAGEIRATPSSDIGSIGVYSVFYDETVAAHNLGIKVEVFKAGRLKGQGIAGTPLSDEMRDIIQASVLDTYAMFTDFVRGRRALNDAAIDAETMQGLSYSGADALKLGLVDEIISA